VLVVEDNPNVLKLTAAMVESLGFAVLTSMTGIEALDIVAQHPGIDLLLTDVMLAGSINGPVLAQRAVALQPQMKVLFNSGYAEQAIFERGLLRKGVHLIGKPFRKQQLAQKIEEVLGA
jgi:CheY-like chemotaxis protein